MKPHIRRAQSTDLPVLVRLNGVVQDLHVRLAPQVYRADWEQAELARSWAARLTDPRHVVLVGEVDGTVVGAVWAEALNRPQSELAQPRRRLHVHHLVVAEETRRCGLARALLAQIETVAAREGYESVTLDARAENAAAQAAFHRLGYRPQSVALGKTIMGLDPH
jgi:ribosomal protein S18 acetylase RimI-like enzyme